MESTEAHQPLEHKFDKPQATEQAKRRSTVPSLNKFTFASDATTCDAQSSLSATERNPLKNIHLQLQASLHVKNVLND